ncbi:MAG: hypothetical protein R3F31_00565 [Verrucomicrobiales bacterium]
MKIKQSAPLLLLSGFLAVASFPLLAADTEDLNRLLIVTEVATKTPRLWPNWPLRWTRSPLANSKPVSCIP